MLEIAQALNGIPLTEETHTDTTTTHQNGGTGSSGTTTGKNTTKFNPVNPTISRTSDLQETESATTTGSSYSNDTNTEYQRWNGKTQREQIEEATRDIYNTIDALIDEIRTELIDPRNIQDMLDWNLFNSGDLVDIQDLEE